MDKIEQIEELNKKIIELRRENEALKRFNQAQFEFVSMASHELRTPLTVIKGYTSLLMQKDIDSDSEKRGEFLHRIDTQLNHLIKLVNNLLKVSKIKNGCFGIYRDVIDILPIVESVVNNLKSTSSIHRFQIDFEDNFPLIIGDKDKLEEVFTNLLDNSIKYSPAGGKIIIEGKVKEDEVKNKCSR